MSCTAAERRVVIITIPAAGGSETYLFERGLAADALLTLSTAAARGRGQFRAVALRTVGRVVGRQLALPGPGDDNPAGRGRAPDHVGRRPGGRLVGPGGVRWRSRSVSSS